MPVPEERLSRGYRNTRSPDAFGELRISSDTGSGPWQARFRFAEANSFKWVQMVDDNDEPDAHEVRAAFFRDIRALRAGAGNPSFHKIGKDAHCSHDTAHRLIEQEVLVKQVNAVDIAAALGGDRQEWAARWAEAKTAEKRIGEKKPGERRPGAAAAATGTAAATTTAPAREPAALAAGPPPASEPSADASVLHRFRRPLIAAAAVVTVVSAVAAGIGLTSDGGREEGARPLFADTCEGPVNLGRQNDKCVREVQLLLKRAGGELAVDDSFGPETLRRVIAFQVLAGITPNGVVDDTTKRALYEERTRLRSWPEDRVEKRIREVFKEAPDRAVAIARCQSNLDPLYILSNNNGTRNWGVFQLYEARVEQMGGTPRKALDPEWNIKAAHRMWKKHRDFRDWQCDKFEKTP